MKRELIGFLIILSGIFLISIGIVYPKEDVEIVIQTGHNGDVTSVAFSPDGRTIVSGSSDKNVRLWDKATGKEVRRLQGHTYIVTSVAFSPDGFIKSEGRQVMTAGGADETTVMSKEWNNHSVYTHYLLKGLRGAADYNKDKVISIRELQVYLDSTVPKEAKQTPQLFNLNNSEGQFVFYHEGEY